VKASVARGVRAQTQFAGITGQQHLSPDFFDPANYPPLPFDWTPKYEYVPSAPSLPPSCSPTHSSPSRTSTRRTSRTSGKI